MDSSLKHVFARGQRILIVGMGNRIRSDDGVGILLAEKLLRQGFGNILVAENSIENYLGKINRFRPDRLIIIDAVDMDAEAGYTEILPLSRMRNTTTNTHNLSLDTIASLLHVRDIWVLAVQPGNVSFGLDLSEAVRESLQLLSEKLLDHLTKSQKISAL